MIINLVGGDGIGKTTQLKLLQPWIERTFGCPVRMIAKGDVLNRARFPEAGFFGCSYDELSDLFLPRMVGESRALLHYYLYATAIRHYPPREDEVVLLDGYWHKTYAIEAALGIDPEWLRAAAAFLPAPDVSVLLCADPAQVVGRLHTFKSYECGLREECSAEAFIANQRSVLAFLERLAQVGSWPVLDAAQGRETVFAQLQALLHPRIAVALSGRRKR